MKTLLTILLFAITATAQVSVSQQFLDDANTAFKEVVALRTAVEALGKANQANADAVAAYKQVNELLKADNADLRKLKCDKGSFFFIVWRYTRCK